MGCEPSGNNKSGGHETRETQTLTKKKKNDKKKIDPIMEKKREKKSIWSSRGSTSQPS